MLAGGKSLRLGREKALERIDHQSLIERAIDCLSPVSETILIVTSEEQFSLIASAGLKGEVIADFYSGKGALGGVYTGLLSADTFYSLVVGCDMPFLNRALLRHLVDLAPDFDVVVPRLDAMTEPLHAVYSKRCLDSIEHLLRRDRLAISQVFSLVKTRYVGEDEMAEFDPERLSCFNINTQDDLKKAKVLVKQREQSSSIRKDRFWQ